MQKPGSHKKITVIIATLGGSTLQSTISALKKSTIKPKKIILCAPKKYRKKIKSFATNKIKILYTQKQGQVAQRSAGFRRADTPYVLQMDDDIELQPRCIEYLLEAMEKGGQKTACGPLWLWKTTKVPCHKNLINSRLFSLSWTIWKNLKIIPGHITLFGTNPFVEIRNQKLTTLETEWLPGGCVLHRKTNLYKKNFYPFSGKAYSEDVMHSIYLRKNGIRLVVQTKAVAYIHQEHVNNNLFIQIKEILKQSAARRHVLKLMKRPKFPEVLYTCLVLIFTLFRNMLFHNQKNIKKTMSKKI